MGQRPLLLLLVLSTPRAASLHAQALRRSPLLSAQRSGCAYRSPAPVLLAKKKGGQDAGPYKASVSLPVTDFSQRAMAAKREPELQKFWADEGIYDGLAANNPGDVYVLHDGPPYANGDLHIGHALNKILKDVINRYQLLRGRKVRYVPGWDCHGLPIELKVLHRAAHGALPHRAPSH